MSLCLAKGLISSTFLKRKVVSTYWSSYNFNNMSQQTSLTKTLSHDVILFKYENPKYFRMISTFGVVQFIFWSFLGQFCVKDMRDAPPAEKSEDSPWWKRLNLGENKYKNTLAMVCFMLGSGLLATSWLFTLRSVRYLILHKDGKHLSFVTYTPFGPNRILKVPLEKVTCGEGRQSTRVQLPMKVKNIWFYYLLDMKGEFKNAELFDRTAGIYRKFK